MHLHQIIGHEPPQEHPAHDADKFKHNHSPSRMQTPLVKCKQVFAWEPL
jgi:hypothetical protein